MADKPVVASLPEEIAAFSWIADRFSMFHFKQAA